MQCLFCLLYTSDAADEEDSVDLGCRPIIKKKKRKKNRKKNNKKNKRGTNIIIAAKIRDKEHTE